MSAFILSHEDYKLIGSYLLGYALGKHYSLHWWETWKFLESGLEGESSRCEANRKIALKAVNKKLQALYLMNVEAVNQRYDEKIDIDELDLDLYPKTTNARTFIKMLFLLKNNCAEGDVPDTQLFKDLGSYISRLYEEEVREY